MKKNGLFFTGMLAGVTIVFSFLAFGSMRNTSAQASNRRNNSPSSAPFFVDAASTEIPLLADGDDEISTPAIVDGQALNVLTTPAPGETMVYFIPTDNDATATVLYLYNTDKVAHIVPLRGYSYNGVLVYSLNISVGAESFLRLSSDSIAAAPPPSWATPAPIITNFTDFTYFASLSLPHGVKAEGYVLFNPGTGVVDPRADQGAIPLRFSTDPATLFIPSAQNP